MDSLLELLPLLVLLVLVGLWLRLSRARELAAMEARRQCDRYGLQLLDETVGLSALRLRRIHGRRRLERCYGFEVSIDGDDREPGQLWMAGDTLTGLRLPTIETRLGDTDATDATRPPSRTDNVIPLRPRSGDRRLH